MNNKRDRGDVGSPIHVSNQQHHDDLDNRVRYEEAMGQLSDSTEAVALADGDAYGNGLFYDDNGDLQPIQHKGRCAAPKSRASQDEPVSAQLYVNWNRGNPPFCSSGADFEPMHAMTCLVNDGQMGPMSETIILPVVSPTCSMAMHATLGSVQLAELKRLQQREMINRDVMDTSKSDLAHMMKKDNFGRTVEEGDDTMASTRHQHDRNEATETAEEEEQDLLRYKIRREKEKMARDASLVVSSPSDELRTANNNSNNNSTDSRQQRRQEHVDRIHAAEQQRQATTATRQEEERRAELRQQRERLPIFRCKRDLLRCVGENAITVVVGETGSGKTTQLVQYLHEAGYAQYGKVIGCTQPRRLAAVGVARRVSDEVGCTLGSTVGYSIHLDDTTTDDTRIKFMTDGVMLREIVKDADVRRYSIIMLDEAHERSVDTDVLMGVLKQAIRRRGDLKLIVTSATMDTEKFSRFFGGAPCFFIPGQTFDVKIVYSPSLVTDYVAEAVFRVCELHLRMPLEGKHDILVFMSGRDDVNGVCELIKRRLKEMNEEYLSTLLVLPCMSEGASVVTRAAVGVLDPTPSGKRKCVVATNVAETSLTIDGVRYVVDAGFMKTNVFRPKLGMNTLQRYPISQAQAGQRKGRAGRTTEGLCYRLYTEEQFQSEMIPNSVPEIQRCSVDHVVLLLKSIGITHLVNFEFMDPPPPANVLYSMWRLWVLGLMDQDGCITEDGRLALEFPLSPSLAKLLICSTREGCAVEAAGIVAVIAADPKNLMELPKGMEERAQQQHSHFYNNESDHLTLLNVFTNFVEHGKSRQWAADHFVHHATLVRAVDVFDQLQQTIRRLRLPFTSCGAAGRDVVRRCVAQAFCLQSAQLTGTNWGEYRPVLHRGVKAALHPTSAVCTRAELPPFVVYNDLLFLARKQYLVMATAVEPEWITEAARGLIQMQVRAGPAGAVAAAVVASPTSREPIAAPPLPRAVDAPEAPSPASAPAKKAPPPTRRRANI